MDDMTQRGRGGRMSTAVNNTFITYDINASEYDIDPLTFMRVSSDEVHGVLRDGLRLHGSIRWYISLEVRFQRHTADGVAWIDSRFASNAFYLTMADDFNEQMTEAMNYILSLIDNMTEHGSGWEICFVKNLRVNMSSYKPLGG
jgi:hypothetical protein